MEDESVVDENTSSNTQNAALPLPTKGSARPMADASEDPPPEDMDQGKTGSELDMIRSLLEAEKSKVTFLALIKSRCKPSYRTLLLKKKCRTSSSAA